MSQQKQTVVRCIDKVAMFLLGAINNLPYVVAIASADRIVKEYNNPTYLGIVLWSNTFSGLFARFINTYLTSINISYTINFSINAASMLIGLVGCAFSKNFWLTIVCVFLIGFSSSFGESVLLCFMTYRRKQTLLSSWSSGTGMAGILGASYSLCCALFTIPYFWSFVALTPVVIIYMCCFFCIINRSPMDEIDSKNVPLLTESTRTNDSVDTTGIDTNKIEEKVSCCDLKILKPVWWYIFNCGSVYFLEYVIQSAFVHCAQDPAKEFKSYTFSLLNLCYQVGVFISRSSLSCFHFPWVGTLTVLQLCFFSAWATQPFFYWMPFWAMIVCMVCVGLFGGCSYVNSFDLIMNNPDLTTKQKEMVTSWNAFFISLFIVFSTLFTFISEQTYLKEKVPA